MKAKIKRPTKKIISETLNSMFSKKRIERTASETGVYEEIEGHKPPYNALVACILFRIFYAENTL